MADTLDLEQWQDADHLASQIVDTWTRWKSARAGAEAEWKETRDFLFATDTRGTSTGSLKHSNSTTLPKLTQLRDNLHANYMAALFPNDNWLSWVGADKDSVTAKTKLIIQNYMRNRLDASNFRATVSDLIYDYIDYGNVIASTEYVVEKRKEEDGTETVLYSGPKAIRKSPYDVVFDITATSFKKSPTITRVLKNLGELEREAKDNPSLRYNMDIVTYLKDRRIRYSTMGTKDRNKYDGISIDGFGTYEQYITSGLVEIIEFEGTIYNAATGELLEDRTITVVDGTHIVRNVSGVTFKVHTGWRTRPDNLIAMGPLANLVGMQYRIDHLENLRADIFDQIANPVKIIAGDVPDFAKGEDIYVGAEGSVQYLHPDTTALNADFQIDALERRMEEFAGAPKEAMGIRTPGEKTAFEVQQLQNAAARIFQNKITHFEETFLEPLVNEMFRIAKLHAGAEPSLERMIGKDASVVQFISINADDLKATGQLKPKGARHFAAKAKLVQDLNSFLGSPIGQRQDVAVHFSGKEIARLMDEQLDLQAYNLFEENVAVAEQLETARLQQAAEQQLGAEGQVDPGAGGVEEMDMMQQ